MNRAVARVVSSLLLSLAMAQSSVAQGALHEMTVMGTAGSEKIRVFNAWYDSTFLPNNLAYIQVYKFRDWLGDWELIDPTTETFLWGVYKVRFTRTVDALYVRGYVPPGLGGISFLDVKALDDLRLFSDDPDRDMTEIRKAIRAGLRQLGMKYDESLLTVHLGMATDGNDMVDAVYAGVYPDKSIVAIIPSKADGTLDVASISSGNQGITLLWLVPHFVVLAPKP